MIKKADRNVRRKQRHVRVRGKVNGCSERPRLCVYRSSKNIYAQLIDDVNGHTLCSASSVEKDFNGGANVEAARKSARSSQRERKLLESRMLFSIAADTYIMVVSRLWPKVPERPDFSFEKGGNNYVICKYHKQ